MCVWEGGHCPPVSYPCQGLARQGALHSIFDSHGRGVLWVVWVGNMASWREAFA